MRTYHPILAVITLVLALLSAATLHGQSPAPAAPVQALLSSDRLDSTALRAQGATHEVAQHDGKAALKVTGAPPEKWPGVFVAAPGGKWDLSKFNRIEADLVNPTDKKIRVGVRVDDDPKADGTKHCNTEGATLEPGQSKTVRVTFGETGGKPAYPLKNEHITGVLFFFDQPKEEQSILVTGVRALGGELPGVVTITADDQWKPIQHALMPEAGTALDFSFLLDGPAGKHGPVVVREGRLEYENLPGRPARFYGSNLVYKANVPSHEMADAYAEQFARAGYNSVRFHHFDKHLQPKDAPDSLTFDADLVDKFDYLFAAFKKRGIYITIDLYATRELKKGEIPEFDRAIAMDYKAMPPLLESARRNWEQFSEKLLTHVNPYTGLAWKDDPALIAINLINEGNVYLTWDDKPDLKQMYLDRFEQWLTQKGITPADKDARKVAFNQFLIQIQTDWFAHGTKFVKDLGTKALVTDANFISMRGHTPMRGALEVVDMHGYWDHHSPLAGWGVPLRLDNKSLARTTADVPSKMVCARLLGKPFLMTELNAPYPNRYRAEFAPIVAGLAAMNGIDALWRFDYVGWNINELRPIAYFSSKDDPVVLLSERIGLLMFLRGDVQPGREVLPYVMTEKFLDDPKAMDWSTSWYPDAYTQHGTQVVLGTTLLDEGQTLDDKLPADQKVVVSTEDIPADRLDGRTLIRLGKENLDLGHLRKQGLLPGKDGQQLHFDRKAGTMRAVTDRGECFIFQEPGTLAGQRVSVTNQEGFAVVYIGALDDAASLDQSRRLLVLHLTDVQNTGAKYRSDKLNLLEKWGELPHLARAGQAEIAVETGASDAKVWALDMSGRRITEVPARHDGQRLIFTAQVHTAAGSTFAYEVAR